MAKNIDRLVTTLMGEGGSEKRWIVPPLYDSASAKLGNKPISLVAAQSMINSIKDKDTVFLIADFAFYPDLPYGETDGPLGVASLARAVRLGLRGLPVIIAGPHGIGALRETTKAAGLNVTDFVLAKETSVAMATEIIFPCVDEKESQKFTCKLMDEYKPKAVIAVETPGPNKKGIKHRGSGGNAAEKEILPYLEYLFHEAHNREILSIGIIDLGNELGSGTIEEELRTIVPKANVCNCPCKSGIACNIKADIVFPSVISNWGAYAITAMIGAILRKPEILQDADTERRMLEACIMAGAQDGNNDALFLAEDGIDIETCQGVIRILHSIVERTIRYGKILE